MFITIKYPTHEDQIRIKSILKITKNYEPESYTITLPEVCSPRDFVIQNVTLEITRESQPTAYLQIQEYLNSKI